MLQSDPRSIIYIEDDQEMIDLVAMILSRRGYEVKGIQGGRAGLSAIIEEKPDLILLDLMMPDVDGWDIFQQIRSREDTSAIPVIIITAKSIRFWVCILRKPMTIFASPSGRRNYSIASTRSLSRDKPLDPTERITTGV